MTEPIRISAKDLGTLAMEGFCARCFWIQRHAPEGLPYQIFPGIFSSIDSYSKKVIHGWFDQRGGAPQWLGALIAEAVGIAPVSGLALVYTEPVTDDAAALHDANARPDGFAMGFAAHVLDVPLDRSQIPPLLRRVRQILDSPSAPPGANGCKDCAKLDGVLGIVR
ncbi:MAG: hypothetical protein Q7S46_08580 [Gallionella sp.]|nr:hypothetical protein [Gallionella sp.]